MGVHMQYENLIWPPYSGLRAAAIALRRSLPLPPLYSSPVPRVASATQFPFGATTASAQKPCHSLQLISACVAACSSVGAWA